MTKQYSGVDYEYLNETGVVETNEGRPMNATTTRKLTRKELTQAVARYARRHGYYARTVRAVTVLFNAAIAAHKEQN